MSLQAYQCGREEPLLDGLVPGNEACHVGVLPARVGNSCGRHAVPERLNVRCRAQVSNRGRGGVVVHEVEVESAGQESARAGARALALVCHVTAQQRCAPLQKLGIHRPHGTPVLALVNVIPRNNKPFPRYRESRPRSSTRTHLRRCLPPPPGLSRISFSVVLALIFPLRSCRRAASLRPHRDHVVTRRDGRPAPRSFTGRDRRGAHAEARSRTLRNSRSLWLQELLRRPATLLGQWSGRATRRRSTSTVGRPVRTKVGKRPGLLHFGSGMASLAACLPPSCLQSAKGTPVR